MTATVSSLGLLDGALALGPALAPETPVRAIAVDSRECGPGTVFVAVQGARRDGARFIQYAARMEALAALCTLEGAVTALETMGGPSPMPLLVVADPRRRLAQIAARLAGAQPRAMAAVTGTSGKTSVADFLRQLWEGLGEKAASFGTTGVRAPGFSAPGGLTTPDPSALHRLLADLAGAGFTHGAMEASSHGLDQRRLDGVALSAVALTNIARDHMDYHPTEAHYAAAKLRLFTELAPEGAAAVANSDDPRFALVERIAAARDLRLIPVGEGEAATAGLRILETGYAPDGQSCRFAWRGTERDARLPLIGAFQARNALTAAGMAIGCGADAEAVFEGLAALKGVRGRMELVGRRLNGAAVFVDYAHKPDALAAALRGLRPHVAGRVHVVFGAGGDRDRGKRPLMGAAAAAHADVAIVTDDNPRSEDPAAIRAAILEAAPEAVEVGDRAEAILRGVDGLEPGDALLIAGKGHETGQIVAGDVLPFDDAEQARAAILALDGEEDEFEAMLKDLDP